MSDEINLLVFSDYTAIVMNCGFVEVMKARSFNRRNCNSMEEEEFLNLCDEDHFVEFKENEIYIMPKKLFFNDVDL